MTAYLGYTVDEDAVSWLTSYGSIMTYIREEVRCLFDPPPSLGFWGEMTPEWKLFINFCPKSALGASGGRRAPNVNLRPPISETTRARKLNLKIPLNIDMVKYQHWVQKYYIIRHNIRTAAILIFDKCIYPRQTTANARRVSAYMSSRALATTTTSS